MVVLFGHFVMQLTGNMLFAGWILYVLTPVYNMFRLNDEENVDKKYETNFSKSWMFDIPLWIHVFAQILTWMYGLVLYSEKY